jgi:cephalosporin-C deacetylase-like acetyl esterase
VRRRNVLGVGLAGVVTAVAGCNRPSAPVRAAPASGSPTGAGFDLSTYRPPDFTADQLRGLYKYDPGVALGATLNDRRDDAGMRVEDLSYNDGHGGQATAIVLSPSPERGRRPAIVFAHDGGADRQVWMSEATKLVARGAVAVLADPTFAGSGDAARDSAAVVKAVVGLRRTLDLLGRRSDVDTRRLAFAGHAIGGAQALIMSGVETRLSAIVTLAARSRVSQLLSAQSKPADVRVYLDALTRFDGVRYLRMPVKRVLLLQFGKAGAVPDGEIGELVQAAGPGAQRADYAGVDDLIGHPPAVADRAAFLGRVLRLS